MSPGPAGFGTVSFSIQIPAKGAPAQAAIKKRLPKVIPGNTATIAVIVNSSAPLDFACSMSTCTGTFQAPAGQSDTIAIQALDASSNILAAASTTQMINPNGVNVVNLTLNLWANAFSISSVPAGLSSAASGTASLSVTAFQGDSVINGALGNPITLSVNDTTGTIGLTNPTLSATTQSTTLAYTFSPATAQSENWLTVTGTATGTTPTTQLFEVGRTFYTFTGYSVVGFAPGSPIPTRTVNIPDGVFDVRSMTCDGTNLYLADYSEGFEYGFAPGAAAPFTYNLDYNSIIWMAATGLGGRATVYNGSFNGPTSELQGAVAVPVPLPPNAIAFTSAAVDGNAQDAVVVDPLGNVYTAAGGFSVGNGGFNEYPAVSPGVTPSNLQSITRTGTANTSSNMIAIDTGTAPTTVYTSDNSDSGGVISEYDTAAAAPTKTSADNANLQVYVDPAGRVYTGHAAGTLDVYARRNINGAVLYQLPANSVVFDSAGYTYALTTGSGVVVYAPGTLNPVIEMGGALGTPSDGPASFGAFCQ
jgi:hypothetical protein